MKWIGARIGSGTSTHTRTGTHIRRWLWSWRGVLVAIFALSIAIRMPFLHVPLITDEGGYAYTTHYGLSGRTLYRLLWFDRTQGILWVYRVIFAFGHTVVAIRLFAALYNAFSALLVYVIARRLADKQTGLLAALAFALFSVMPHVQGFTANAELFMTLPALASLALLLPLHRRYDPRRLFASGLCAGVAVVIKPAEIAAIIVAIGIVFLRARREGADRPAARRRLAILGGGILLGLLPAIIDGFVRDGRAYVMQVIVYRGATESIISSRAFGRLGHSLWSSIVVGGDLLPLIVLAALALSVYRRTIAADARRLAPLWFGASLFGIALGGNWFTHYFFQMLPPLAIYAAIGLRAAFADARASLWRVRLVTAMTLSVMLTTAYSGYYFVAQPADISWELYHDRAYQMQDALVAYLKANTTPGDRIYVAFEGPEIYYLSERQSIYPVVWRQPILNDPATLDHLIGTLDTPYGPRYIVDMDAPKFRRAHDRLRPVLEHRYRLATIINGVQIYARVPSTWDLPYTEKVDR